MENEVKITLQEAKDRLIQFYSDAEDYAAELKENVEEVLGSIDTELSPAKESALVEFAKKVAKGKHKELKAKAEAVIEIINDLEE